MSDKPSLEERVNQFNTMSLPGQPMGMHMGTSYLVNDLWREIRTLREMVGILEASLAERQPTDPFQHQTS